MKGDEKRLGEENFLSGEKGNELIPASSDYDLARAHVFVSGRVQGVFFRSETRYEASRRNVTGWVRNLSDGRVEAIFEGEKNDVKKLIKFCWRGPPGARVTKVQVLWEDYTGEFKDFKISLY